MTSAFSKTVTLLHLPRYLSTASRLRALSVFGPGPSPPRLPEEEQRRFEELQRASTGAFSTPRTPSAVNQVPSTTSLQPNTPKTPRQPQDSSAARVEALSAKVRADGSGEELHPSIRRGAKPEFEGEKNPKTGETGGPKNEPLRWGGAVDWSYNGRVTDF